MRPPVRIRHGCRFVWDLPDHVAQAVRPHVRRVDWLVPTWCHELTFTYHPQANEVDPSVSMRVQWAVEYRSAEIRVFPPFVAADDAERWRTVLHEFCHLPMCGVYSVFYKATDSLGGEMEEVYNELFRRELEGCTQDFARALELQCPVPLLTDHAP